MSEATARHDPSTGYWGLQEIDRRAGAQRFQLMEANAPPEAVVAHGHNTPHAVFVFKGTYITAANVEREPLATAALVINPPDMWHRDRFAKGKGSFLAVDLPKGMPGTSQPRILRDAGTIGACLSLVKSIGDAEPLTLEEHSRAIIGPRDQAKARAGSRLDHAYAAIMESDAPEKLVLADLAHLADCHPNYVSSAFRKRYGVTAARLLRLRRVERACSLLRSGGQPLADIAQQLGFTDQAHFSRVFSAELGRSPGRWRRMVAKL